MRIVQVAAAGFLMAKQLFWPILLLAAMHRNWS